MEKDRRHQRAGYLWAWSVEVNTQKGTCHLPEPSVSLVGPYIALDTDELLLMGAFSLLHAWELLEVMHNVFSLPCLLYLSAQDKALKNHSQQL